MERERDYQEFAAYEQVASLMERHGVAEDATPKETIERVGAAGQLTDADLGALAELGWDTTAWSAGRPPFDQERAMALLLAAGYRYAEMLAADPDAQPLAASYVFEDVLITAR